MTILDGRTISWKTLSLAWLEPSGPCMTYDQRPPGANSKTSNVLVKPSGPHQRARRSGRANASKTLSAEYRSRRSVLNVVTGRSSLASPFRDDRGPPRVVHRDQPAAIRL